MILSQKWKEAPFGEYVTGVLRLRMLLLGLKALVGLQMLLSRHGAISYPEQHRVEITFFGVRLTRVLCEEPWAAKAWLPVAKVW